MTVTENKMIGSYLDDVTAGREAGVDVEAGEGGVGGVGVKGSKSPVVDWEGALRLDR